MALEIPNKIERLCFLRNELLNYLKTKPPTEYVGFIDLDNINNKLTKRVLILVLSEMIGVDVFQINRSDITIYLLLDLKIGMKLIALLKFIEKT